MRRLQSTKFLLITFILIVVEGIRLCVLMFLAVPVAMFFSIFVENVFGRGFLSVDWRIQFICNAVSAGAFFRMYPRTVNFRIWWMSYSFQPHCIKPALIAHGASQTSDGKTDTKIQDFRRLAGKLV